MVSGLSSRMKEAENLKDKVHNAVNGDELIYVILKY